MFGVAELGEQGKLGRYYENYDRKWTPRIECPDVVRREEPFDVSIIVDAGSELSDQIQFRVRWVTLYFFPELFGSPYRLKKMYLDPISGSYSPEDEDPAQDSLAVTACRIDESGMLYAIAFCNVQEFFYSRKKINVL